MSAFSGSQQKGATNIRRKFKREQAEARNALTPVERTRQYRLTIAGVERLLAS